MLETPFTLSLSSVFLGFHASLASLPCALEDSGAPNRSPSSREIDHPNRFKSLPPILQLEMGVILTTKNPALSNINF